MATIAAQAVGAAAGLLTGGLGSRAVVTGGLGNFAPLILAGYAGAFVPGGAVIAPQSAGGGGPLVLNGLRSRSLITRGLGNFGPRVAAGDPGPFLPGPQAPPIVKPTSLDEILANVRRAVLLAGIVPAGPDVQFARNLQAPNPTGGSPQVLINRGPFRPVDAYHRGGGVNVPVYQGLFRVAVNATSTQDANGTDGVRMLGPFAPPTGLAGPYGSTAAPDATLGTQLAADPAYDPALAFTPPGLEAVVHKIIALLTLSFIEDPQGNHLTTEPLQLQGNAEPVEYRDSPTWSGIVLTFLASYYARLT